MDEQSTKGCWKARVVAWSQSGRLQTTICVLLIALCGLALDLYHLGANSIWFDEALSVIRAQQSLPVLLKIISTTQPNMALYYIILHFWLAFVQGLGGRASEFVVRFPSACFAVLNGLLLYALARLFVSRKVSLLIALCYLLNTLQLSYAQDTRAYTLQLLLLDLSWYALWRLFSRPLTRGQQAGWWLCFVLASTLALYTQLFSTLVLLAQLLLCLLLWLTPGVWRSQVRSQMRALCFSWGCIAVLSLPVLYASRIGAKTAWLPAPQPADIYQLFLTISAQSNILLMLCLMTVLPGLVLICLTCSQAGRVRLKQSLLLPAHPIEEKFWINRITQARPVSLLLLCWIICPLVLSYLISIKTTTHLFSSRYLLVIVPPLFLFLAVGLSVLRWNWLKYVLAVCLLLLSVRYLPNYYHAQPVEEWRTGVSWLQQEYRPGDGLICYNNAQGCAVDIEYYLQAYPAGDAHFDSDSPGYFPWVSYDTTNRLGNYQAALDRAAIQAYVQKHQRIFFAIGRANLEDSAVQSTLSWLQTHYILLSSKQTSILTIYLYQIKAS